MDKSNHLLGRQPILNRLEEIVAYELLFRSPNSLASATIHDSTQASASVIINTLSGFGIQDILGKHRGFINVEADLLMSDNIELLPTEIIGLELLENIVVTPEVIERCRTLKKAGCLLALDDHEYNQSYEPLYDGLVDIVKVDLFKTPLDQLYGMVERFRRFPVKLLAEKVDTRAVFLRCRSLGFDMFQGYFFARPSLLQKKRLEDSAGILFELLQQLSSDADLDQIEQTFKKSPAMTYKLLLLVNSVSTGLREKIRTVRHAISIIGLNQLKRWVQLSIFAADDHRGIENPLVELAAVRAAFLEELARLHPYTKDFKCYPDQAFMVGILSLLKDIYEISLDDIVNGLNLSNEIREALLTRSGPLGDLLSLAEKLDQLDFAGAAEYLDKVQIPLETVQECQKNAYNWRDGLE